MPAVPLPTSLYTDTARPAPSTPSLDTDRTVSVAIIGAGFAGLSAALHLAEMGVEVCVLEANEPGWGASGRNGGQINPGLKFNPDELLARFGGDLGRRMIDMAWGAPDFTFDLISRLAIDCDARHNGTLRAATNALTANAVGTTAAQCLAHGMPTRLLDTTEAQLATGTDRYSAALFDPRGGDLHPLNYARGLAAAARMPARRSMAIAASFRLEDNPANGFYTRTEQPSQRINCLLLQMPMQMGYGRT